MKTYPKFDAVNLVDAHRDYLGHRGHFHGIVYQGGGAHFKGHGKYPVKAVQG